MADFAIASVVIRADGWSADVTLTGEAGGQGAFTYDFGTPGATATSKFYLSVTSEGYSSAGVLGTVTRTVYGTKVIRKPTPNEASLDETDSGADLVVRVALSDFIYDDDDAGVGGSGADPIVQISAGWATHTDTDTNTVFTAESATNNSTQDYPKAFGQWAMVPFQSFTSDPTLKFTARHRHKIAAVKFTLTDASANAVSGFATAEVANQRSVSSLYACEYEKSLSLTTLTQGEVLTGNAILYPVVGDADSVFDTATAAVTRANVMLGQCNLSFFNDKTGAATVTRYVATTGNDTTGDGLSALTPWLTVQKALTEGSADDIECAAGTYTFGAVTAPASLNRWRVIRPATGAAVTISLDGLEQPNTPHLCFRDLTIQKATGNAYIADTTQARYVLYDGVTTDKNGQAATATAPTLAYGYAAFITGCTIDDAQNWGLQHANGTYAGPMWLDGNIIASGTVGVFAAWTRAVANEMVNFGLGQASAVQHEQDPGIVEFNKIHSFSSTGAALLNLYVSTDCNNGSSIVGNLTEKTATTSALLQFAADRASTHTLLWHNTFAGERAILYYNSTGTVAVPHLLASVVGNVWQEYNTKHDLFGTPNANRIGGWPCLHGVGYVANGSEAAQGFNNAYPGLYSSGIMAATEGESATTPCTAGYTDDASYTGTALGDGDYLPAAPSDLIAALPAGWAMVPKDLFGTPIGNVGEGEIGAVQLAPAPTITSIDPTSGAVGASGVLTINGTGFVDGAVATGNIGVVALGTTNFISSTQLTVTNYTVNGVGTSDITVTNPDEQAVTSVGAFTVTASGGVSQIRMATIKSARRRRNIEEVG